MGHTELVFSVFGRRVITPCVQSLGTRLHLRHTLKIIVKIGVISFRFCLMVSYVTPSAPGDFLEGSFPMTSYTSSSVIASTHGSRSGMFMFTSGLHGGSGMGLCNCRFAFSV